MLLDEFMMSGYVAAHLNIVRIIRMLYVYTNVMAWQYNYPLLWSYKTFVYVLIMLGYIIYKSHNVYNKFEYSNVTTKAIVL